jgi:HK97 family phage major capsid protein
MARLSEKIAALHKQRSELVTAYEAVVQKGLDEDRDLTEDEKKEQEVRRLKIDQIDPELDALERDLRVLATRAAPVISGDRSTNLPATVPAQPMGIERDRRGRIVKVGNPVVDEYPGAGFVRMFLARAIAKHDMQLAQHVALQKWGNQDFADLIRQYDYMTRASVPPMNTGEAVGSGGGSSLIVITHLGAQFVDMLRAKLLVPRLPGGVNLNFNGAGKLIIPRQIGGVTGAYIGEGNSIITQRLTFDQIVMVPSKMAVLAAYTNEMLRRSDPGFEQLVLNDLTRGTARTIDAAFISTAGASAAPAGILNYNAQLSAGNIPAAATVNQVSDCLRAIITQLRLANVNMDAPAWIFNPRTVEYLRLLRGTTVEIYAFKDEIDAGRLLGFPIIDSTTVPINGTDTSVPYVLLDTADIVWADDLPPVLDASEEATIQADTAPASPPAAPYVSAFQQDLVISRIRMSHSWSVRHNASISWATSLV